MWMKVSEEFGPTIEFGERMGGEWMEGWGRREMADRELSKGRWLLIFTEALQE